MNNRLTERDMRTLLRVHCEEAGGQSAWAKKNDFSPQYVTDVLKGRRDVGERIAMALGCRTVVEYEPIRAR